MAFLTDESSFSSVRVKSSLRVIPSSIACYFAFFIKESGMSIVVRIKAYFHIYN